METMKKGVTVGNSHTYDMERLYASFFCGVTTQFLFDIAKP